MKSDLIDLTLRLHHETEKGIFVSGDGDSDNARWLPKSQIEVERKARGIIIVTLPEWLAVDKELV